jgi:hypothetical protein
MYTIKENFLSSVFKSLQLFCSIQMLNHFGSTGNHKAVSSASSFRFLLQIPTGHKEIIKLQGDWSLTPSNLAWYGDKCPSYIHSVTCFVWSSDFRGGSLELWCLR